MDPDPSPGPRAKPEAEAGAPSVEPLERSAGPSVPVSGLFSRIARLFGWRQELELDLEDPANDPNALGPAFRSGSPAELAMVNNILRLRDLRVEDVMTPRADIEAVAEDTSLEDVIDAFDTGGFSRMPVYRETLDDPLGFVHMKDLALSYGFGRNGNGDGFDLGEHVRTALFVPPSMRIASLLQKMQGERVHMALVIDEFGGVDGLITIEDLVEQVVGDIEDEHDAEDEQDTWVAETESVYLVSARTDIQDFGEAAGLDLVPEGWEEDATSLGGLVFTLANRVPTRGEVILHPNGYEFEIIDADARRIKRMRVSLANSTSPLRQAAE
ncbi:MAG: hemolysin family protein [Pseudomonadota bacterium]